MKESKRLQALIWLSIWVLMCPTSGWAKRVPPQTPESKKHQALNQYVAFANECTHILSGTRKRLEDFNRESIQFLASNGAIPLQFRIHDMIENYQFHSTYQGPCLWVKNSSKTFVNIKYLYDETSLKSAYLPAAGKNQLNKTRNDIMFLMIEFLGLCDTLEAYTTSGRYQREPELKTAFWALKRCEALYQTFGQLHQELFEQINAIAEPAPAELMEMREMIAHSREIIRSVQSENQTQLSLEIEKLEALIAKIETYHTQLKKELYLLGLNLKDSKSGYENMIVHAEALIKSAKEYQMQADYDPAYHIYGSGYYYFNHDLLDGFNHHKYGMLAYYNRFLSFANQTLIKMMEEPPVFQVIYKLTMDMPVLLASEIGPPVVKPTRSLASRATQAMIRPVTQKPGVANNTAPITIVATTETPEVPTPSYEVHRITDQAQVPVDLHTEITPVATQQITLAGAAANHLIFVVDVSSSMDKPEKLPVMRDALVYLVEIMRPEDRITLIAYSAKASVRLEATSAADKDRIMGELQQLHAKGKTNMRKGLNLAYQLAEEHFIPQGNNRVILASDGMIEMNRRARHLVQRMVWEDITLSTLSLNKGSAEQVQSNLRQLSELGGGSYHEMNADNAAEVIFEEATAVMRR